MARRKYAHNKGKARKRTVRVKAHCRRRGLVGWMQRAAARKGMPF